VHSKQPQQPASQQYAPQQHANQYHNKPPQQHAAQYHNKPSQPHFQPQQQRNGSSRQGYEDRDKHHK